MKSLGWTATALLVLLAMTVLAPTGAWAGANTYSAGSTLPGPLTPDGSQQDVVTIPFTKGGGGDTVTSFTVSIQGSVSAGDVTGVYLFDGTKTWSATGSYGNGSSVNCTGASGKLSSSPLYIRVTLAAGAAGKTVGATLVSSSSVNDVGLPQASGILSIGAAGSHDLSSFVDNAPGTVDPDGSTQYLFATIGSAATGGGVDIVNWPITVNDNGTTLAPGDVTVYVEYGGAAVGNGSPVSIGAEFNIAVAGVENGGSDWTFKVLLNPGADTKDVQISVGPPAAANDTGASLPRTAPAASFCSATAPAAPRHDLNGFTDNAPGTADPDGVTKHLFATIGSVAANGGADLVNWPITVNDNGTTLAPGDLTVFVEYNGAEVGSGSPVSIGAEFNIAVAGAQSGGNDWTFRVQLAAGADTKDVQLSIALPAAATNAGAALPRTAPAASFCSATAAAGPSHDLTGFTDNAPGTADPNGATKHLFATIGSVATGGGADIANWPVTVNDNGTTLAPGDVTVFIEYNGAEVGSGSPSSIGAEFNIAVAGAQNGGNNWTFRVQLAAGADTKDVQLSIAKPAAATNAGAALPRTAPAAAFCTATVAAGLGCADCHANPPTDATGGRNVPAGAVEGNHNIHVSGWIGAPCDDCHTASGGYAAAHGNGNVEMAAAIQGGSYSKSASFPQSAAPAMGSCSATLCHGSGTPTWAGASLGCDDCHGDGAGKQHPTATFRTAPALGAHVIHMESTGAVIQGGVLCADCHSVPGATNTGGHFEVGTAAEVDMSAGDGALNSTSVSYDDGTNTCTVTYCHGANMPNGSTDGSDTTPAWGGSSTGCDYCHGLPPSGATHVGKTYPTGCDGCHDTLNGAGAIANLSQHIHGTVEVAGCTGCHGTDPKEYPPAAAYGGTDGVGAHVKHIEATGTMMTKEVIGGEADATGYWCAECHTTTRGSGGHDDNVYPADLGFGNAVEAGYNSHSASYSPASGGSSGDSDGTGGSCSVYCHGAAMPSGSNNGSNSAPLWTDSLSGCGTCHGSPPNTGSHGGGEALTDCVGCHPDTVDAAGAIATAANHIDGAVQYNVSCTGCHTSGAGGAPVILANTAHSTDAMDAAIGGAAWTCEDCHTAHNAGTIEIPNIQWMGDGSTWMFEYTTNGDGGIALGGPRAGGNTEAEICWNCHSVNGIDEWGVNTDTNGGSPNYDFGSLNQASWIGATWTSANFSYKTETIQSTHAADSAGSEGVDTLGSIRCTYCHDVHDTDGPSGKPYLRGSWVGNPYKEDGAPQSGTVYTENNDSNGEGGWAAVPRASNSTAMEMGGYWIDANSGNPTSGYSAAQFGGLCERCHGNNDGTYLSGEIGTLSTDIYAGSGWVSGDDGHANSVKGGAGPGPGGNIFDARGGTAFTSGAGTDSPLMNFMYTGSTQANTQPAWDYNPALGFRGQRPVTGLDANLEISGQPNVNGVNAWGVDVIGAVTDSNYHQFSCSKCHNPHASRLPKLMITNCLDTKHNTWDNDHVLNPFSGINQNRAVSNWSSAQNCHRLGGVAGGGTDGDDPRADQAGQGGGWNTVTPW